MAAKPKTDTPAADTNGNTTPATDGATTETAATTKAKGERVAPVIGAVTTDVPLPTIKNKRGSKSAYDFSVLSVVGASMPILNKTAKQMASVVSNANKKAMVKRTDSAGNTIFKVVDMKDANGVVIGKTPTTEPEMDPGVHYIVVDCDPAADPANAMSRVFRDK